MGQAQNFLGTPTVQGHMKIPSGGDGVAGRGRAVEACAGHAQESAGNKEQGSWPPLKGVGPGKSTQRPTNGGTGW